MAALDIYRGRHNISGQNLSPQQILNALTEAGIAAPESTLQCVVMVPGWRKIGRQYTQGHMNEYDGRSSRR